ncbi:hypothetical protein E2C01_061417 [Portunus trituberculatus]|uniref:Uncharacterized protein n=1 Tax=Portunus trituberculatus TaxID=210409 RepID=A0A5B7HB82_PORTR|nr:hypothetical protein [Portunus trituberculatus]
MSHFAAPGRIWVTFLHGFKSFFDTTETFSKSFDVQAMHRFFFLIFLFFCDALSCFISSSFKRFSMAFRKILNIIIINFTEASPMAQIYYVISDRIDVVFSEAWEVIHAFWPYFIPRQVHARRLHFIPR